jgi:hypothetical protein
VKYLTARSQLMPAIMPMEDAGGGLHRPWLNGCAVVPMVCAPRQTARQVTKSKVEEWLDELETLNCPSIWDDVRGLTGNPTEFLLARGLNEMARKDSCLRWCRTTQHCKNCVASMCNDGFAASRVLSAGLFKECRAMLKTRSPQLFASVVCRDVLCVFEKESQAVAFGNDPRFEKTDGFALISRDPFVLTLDGVAGTRKSELDCGDGLGLPWKKESL